MAKVSDWLFAGVALSWLAFIAFAGDYFLQPSLSSRFLHSHVQVFVCQVLIGLMAILPIALLDDQRSLWTTMLKWPRVFSFTGAVMLASALVVCSPILHWRILMIKPHHVTAFIIGVTATLAIIEEIGNRAMLLGILVRVMPSWGAVLSAGIFFGTLHAPILLANRHSSSFVLAIGIARISFLGVSLGIAALRFRSIWPGAIAHIGNNLLWL
jgi:membrane protease YdiL (CAAX protease family)